MFCTLPAAKRGDGEFVKEATKKVAGWERLCTSGKAVYADLRARGGMLASESGEECRSERLDRGRTARAVCFSMEVAGVRNDCTIDSWK